MVLIIDTQKPLANPEKLVFATATKTKPIRAKSMQHLLNDESVLNKFLLQTLEGNQFLKANSMVCIGASDDAWQQKTSKLFAKYDVTDVDDAGWMICHPKPDNEVWASQVTALCGVEFGSTNEFSLKAQWGERQADGSSLLYGKEGDYILRNKEDETDVWIVQKSLFENTYEIKDE